MISAQYYQFVYLLIVTIATLFAFSFYNRWGRLIQENSWKTTLFISLLLLLFSVLFIGTRPVDAVFVDMVGYDQTYATLFNGTFYFNWDTDNLIWDNFFEWMACNRIPFTTWLLIVSSAYFGLMFWSCYKLFDKDILLAFVTYLGAFSTFSYGVNGMKAGVAASVFLVAIAYREKLWISIPLVLLSYGFHHSMSMVIAAYFAVLFVKNPKYFFWGWLICVVLATLHVTYFQTLFAGYTDEHGAEYLLSKRDSGYRLDFILYSAVPVYLGYQCVYKYNFRPKMYIFLLNLYLVANSLWMLCMYAEFNNRIAYLSWLMYPIVLLYPFISRNENLLQGKYIRWVVYGHLGFTLFMTLIYYAE